MNDDVTRRARQSSTPRRPTSRAMVSSDDAKKEDLSAYSREDLVYKAKLAEQAERCVDSTRTRLDSDAGTTTGRVSRARRGRRASARSIAREGTTRRTRGTRSIARSIARAVGTRPRATGSMIVRSEIGVGVVGRETQDES